MKRVKLRNKIFVKLLAAIALSLVATYVVFLIIAQFVAQRVNLNYFLTLSEQKTLFLLYATFFLIIIHFIVVFLLLVRQKIVYLKNISECVNDIANGKLGLMITKKGNDELSILAENINFMSRELAGKFEHERQLENAKNELITNVSHDLRTPLTSIIGYMDLLMNKQYKSGDQFQEYLETIYSKTQRLKHLIDELFEYTRLSSPDITLHLNTFDVTALLEQIVGEYIPIFEREKIHVNKVIPEEEIYVVMDVEKLVRVYENLFMNALKYSTKPSELMIILEVKENRAKFSISNCAKKPRLDDMNQLFERFVRGNKARSNNEGTGLGLAISKRIVQLHNGSIYATYNEGRMNFIVELPVCER